ncbi:MAG: type IV secretory system conjugative DNA transfer family protein, partial [Pacificimonas sp.]
DVHHRSWTLSAARSPRQSGHNGRIPQSSHDAVRKSANRLMQKSEKELTSVISTVSANTHFLDSDAIRRTLTHSTFDFGALKDDERPLSIYLVLPADRLNTHGRWLRLLVSMALTSVARRVGKPKKSALFILDEFAALGRLQMVEDAFGLMAGFGMRIWAILQDLNQLQDLYKNRWQTFLANAGVIQIFGISDSQTADYFSRYMGQQTMEKISQLTADTRKGGVFSRAKPDFTSMQDSSFARPLMTGDELMKLEQDTMILLISPYDPMICRKIHYYKDDSFFLRDGAGNYVPDGEGWATTYTVHPDHQQPSGNYATWASGKTARGEAGLREATTTPTGKTWGIGNWIEKLGSNH